MSAFETLADHLVTELPITRLQSLFVEISEREVSTGRPGGNMCGLGCDAGQGFGCGFSCRPPARTRDVVDSEGRLGLTAKDLADIRTDLPRLRQAVIEKVESHLGQLK